MAAATSKAFLLWVWKALGGKVEFEFAKMMWTRQCNSEKGFEVSFQEGLISKLFE